MVDLISIRAMALTDDGLLTFDNDELLRYRPETAHEMLATHGDAFRYQLVMALALERQASRLEETEGGVESVGEGYVQALRHTAADLRQGEYLPGGDIYREIWGEAEPTSADGVA